MNLEPGVDPARFLADRQRCTVDRDRRPPGGRSSVETGTEMLAAVDDHAVPHGTVVLVGHGGATVDLLRTLLGDDELERRRPDLVIGSVPAGALTTLEHAEGRWSARTIADVDHLDQDDRTG